ncbi:hypothetical protein BV25DRAFT_1155638 [Artomyces pyxidatus]|uniref:Uncharacterized protein n=1 Tax=Artomyces pyxidatus TaxID=48021 RepID=A0ACB8SSL0_9AGAM|nr:hypothetical protein BV25DRAFT_1155638 [Artomyces pyxidatus]
MATAANVPAIAERADIHKACRALEVVVNLLNDYSEAARAVVTLQKKLSKALRDAASVKATSEIPANAFNASANVFEVLSDIDSKFAKFVDKECDGVSGEVRKWFKKLAKEEKAHDERIANANNRIKQAGQIYEKKAKKNAYDTAEEHTRYINLLSSLGPEISQEKYNHALAVNQRNTAVTYAVAVTLSRVADAEWLRSSEGVRRFSPLIGQLGEWKTLCEGNWTGALPSDLPNIDEAGEGTRADPPDGRYADLSHREQDSPANRPRAAPLMEQLNSTKPSTPHEEHRKLRSPTSLASLASFPSPPTHFPLPPVSGSMPPTPVPSSPVTHYNSLTRQMQHSTSSDVSASSSGAAPALPKVAESPMEGQTDAAATPALTDGTMSPASPPGIPMTPTNSASVGPDLSDQKWAGLGFTTLKETTREKIVQQSTKQNAPTVPPPPPLPSNAALSLPQSELPDRVGKVSSNNSRSSSYTAVNSNTFKKGDYLDDREFGVDRTMDSSQLKSKSLDSTQSRAERTDTMKSSGSVVAAMRDRLARTTGPASPPPRDLPRLPLSVATIATKYQTVEESPVSPRLRTISPTNELPRRSYDAEAATTRSEQSQPFPSSPPVQDELTSRRQRLEELEELERREKALEQRVREREAEERARERADTSRSRAGDGYGSDVSRSQQPSFAHRPYSQASIQSTSQGPYMQPPSLASRHSYSTTSLPAGAARLPPPSPIASRRDLRTPTLPQQSQRQHEDPPHARDCQCPACTVARYAEAPLTPRPPEREKPKGWMRRLSMPVVVGHAFSLDSKKDKYAVGGGISSGKGIGGLGGANRSVTSFGSRR